MVEIGSKFEEGGIGKISFLKICPKILRKFENVDLDVLIPKSFHSSGDGREFLNYSVRIFSFEISKNCLNSIDDYGKTVAAIEEVTEEVNSTARHPLENVYNEVSKMVENGPKFDEIGGIESFIFEKFV